MNPTRVGPTFPAHAVIGQMVYRSDLSQLFAYTGAAWIPVTGPTDTADWMLFLDDERFPGEAGWDFDEVFICRSSFEAQHMVERKGPPVQISFDHDLGGDDTGFKFMWWLINGHLDEKWDLAKVKAVQVHSANEVGAKKLIALWENFCQVHKIEMKLTRVWPGDKT